MENRLCGGAYYMSCPSRFMRISTGSAIGSWALVSGSVRFCPAMGAEPARLRAFFFFDLLTFVTSLPVFGVVWPKENQKIRTEKVPCGFFAKPSRREFRRQEAAKEHEIRFLGGSADPKNTSRKNTPDNS